jgi:hypothetical protein
MASQETTKGRSTKVKVTAPLEAPTDFSDAISSIERDLNQHRLGTFRINAKDMSFKWADCNNRALTSMDRMNILLTSMQNGLYRTDIRHRMSGLISGDKIDKSISSLDHPMGLGTEIWWTWFCCDWLDPRVTQPIKTI